MERFELNAVIGRPIEEIFAVLSNLENDLVVDIDSIYHDASMIPFCSDKRTLFWFRWMDFHGRICVCKQNSNLSSVHLLQNPEKYIAFR